MQWEIAKFTQMQILTDLNGQDMVCIGECCDRIYKPNGLKVDSVIVKHMISGDLKL